MNIRHLKKQKNISILILVRTAPFNKHCYIFPTELQCLTAVNTHRRRKVIQSGRSAAVPGKARGEGMGAPARS